MLQFGGFPIASRLFPKKQDVPFSNLRIYGIHAPPRSLSQLVTTFIGTRAERSPNWVVASHVCFPHHASNPSVSSHANSASSESRLKDDSPQPFPLYGIRTEVLSIHPTALLYMNESVGKCPSMLHLYSIKKENLYDNFSKLEAARPSSCRIVDRTSLA